MIATAHSLATQHGLACASFPRIKPFPTHWLSGLSRFDWVGVIEEHHRAGGLFSALVENTAAEGIPPPKRWRSYSLEDRFTESCGSYAHALSEHRLDAQSLGDRVAAELEADGM
jgi:transketolase